MTQAGQRLKDLTGVAAILFFALPGIDDISEDENDSSDEERKSENTEEEESGKSQSNFDDEQLDILMNEGLIGYEDDSDISAGNGIIHQ